MKREGKMNIEIETEFNYFMQLQKAALQKRTGKIYTCPYCGLSLLPLFDRIKEHKDYDFASEPIYCPCCGQQGAF